MNKINDKINVWEKEVSHTDEVLSHRIYVCEHSEAILSAAQKEFRLGSSLFNKTDMTFLVFALVLHGMAKYWIRKMRMMKDKDLAKMNPLHNEEHSARLNRKYYCSREEIISNPVPFDAIVLDPMYKHPWWQRQKPGFKGTNHRFTALGHDPLLGLIFGTANIMTSTITRSDGRSWHVRTEQHERLKRNGKMAIEYLDTICEPASTLAIFEVIRQRLHEEGTEGWITLGIALAKEIVHLLTDMPSLMSLPLPAISAISPDFAHKLSIYGINTGTIVEGSIANKIINFVVAYLHRLYMKAGEDERLFQARTVKLITTANLIATGGDLAVTIYQAYCGDMKAMRKFDLGGYMCTLGNLVSSTTLISRLECEFMNEKFKLEYNKIKLDSDEDKTN